MAYSSRGQLAMTSRNEKESLQFSRRALELATQFGDHAVRSHALNNIGSVLLRMEDQVGLTTLEESLTVALQHNLQVHAGRSYANLVSIPMARHMPEVVERYLADAIEYCETHEVQESLAYIRAWRPTIGPWPCPKATNRPCASH
jgi:hypothetical protein